MSRPNGALVGPRGAVADQVTWAVSWWARIRGVLGRRPLAAGEAMALASCRQVHTIGVGYPLDVVFCDAELRVLHVQTIRPLRISRRVGAAEWCFELPAGRAERCGIAPGVQLAVEERP